MKPYYPYFLRLLPKKGDVVEIGAGEADFLCYASAHTQWNIRGYDIHEHAGLDKDREEWVRMNLAEHGLKEDLYSWVTAEDGIPLPDNSMHRAISLQTLEHIKDVDHLFSEIKRVLRPGGSALHYFPTREILIDPHSGTPLVHLFPKRRRFLLKLFSRLGIGKYRHYKKNRNYTLEHFVDEFDSYHQNLCYFRTIKEYFTLSQKHELEPSIFPLPPFPRSRLWASFLSRFTSICLQQTKPFTKTSSLTH